MINSNYFTVRMTLQRTRYFSCFTILFVGSIFSMMETVVANLKVILPIASPFYHYCNFYTSIWTGAVKGTVFAWSSMVVGFNTFLFFLSKPKVNSNFCYYTVYIKIIRIGLVLFRYNIQSNPLGSY